MLPSPPPVSIDLWLNGTTDTNINVGDLWVTSWDGDDLSLVLIAGAHDTHVTVWLVTDAADTSPAAPSFRLNADWLTGPLVCWPEAQAGMSTALLARRLGNVLTTRDIRAVLIDTWEPDETPNAPVDYYPNQTSDAADESLDAACRYVSMLSDLDTPMTDSANRGILSDRFKKDHGLSNPRDLGRHLKGVPALVTTAFNAERLLTDEEIRTLSDAHRVTASEITTHPEDRTVVALRDPKWKQRVNELMSHRGGDETDARLRTWERAQVAARQARSQNDAALDARIERAFNELLSE